MRLLAELVGLALVDKIAVQQDTHKHRPFVRIVAGAIRRCSILFWPTITFIEARSLVVSLLLVRSYGYRLVRLPAAQAGSDQPLRQEFLNV